MLGVGDMLGIGDIDGMFGIGLMLGGAGIDAVQGMFFLSSAMPFIPFSMSVFIFFISASIDAQQFSCAECPLGAKIR
jgi:hypothetical protein